MLMGTERAVETLRKQAAVLVTNSPGDFLEFKEHMALLYVSSAPDRTLAACFPHCRMVRKPFRSGELLEALAELTRGDAAAAAHAV